MFLILQHTPTFCVPVAIAILFIYSRVHAGPIPMCNFLMFSEQLHLGPFHPSKRNKREKKIPFFCFLFIFSSLCYQHLVLGHITMQNLCFLMLPPFRRCQPSLSLSLSSLLLTPALPLSCTSQLGDFCT